MTFQRGFGETKLNLMGEGRKDDKLSQQRERNHLTALSCRVQRYNVRLPRRVCDIIINVIIETITTIIITTTTIITIIFMFIT